MGDMADFALDCAMDEYEHYERYKNSDLNTQYEQGLIDETGATIGVPMAPYTSSSTNPKPSGPGACPKCGAVTKMTEGVHGTFYGCINFPDCKGSRNG